MSKPKLTPQQLELKRKQDALIKLRNNVQGWFNFKKVKTWGDVYKYTSVPPNSTPQHLSTDVTYGDITRYFQSLIDSLNPTNENNTTKLPSQQPTPTPPSRIPTDVSGRGTTIPTLVIPPPQPPGTEAKEPELILDPRAIPTIDNDYLLPPCAREAKNLIKYWDQRKAASELYYGIIRDGIQGHQVIAAAGNGKTFIVMAALARLCDKKFCDDKTYGPISILYVTKNSVVEQTARVAKNIFGIGIKDGFEVINYESLRAKAGAIWVKEEVRIEGGEEKITWVWRKFMNPVIIVWDENQSLKNYGSIQHQIACQFNEITTPTYQIFVSATPYMRVSEAKCFAVSTRKDITHVFGVPTKLSNATWPAYSSILSGHGYSPEDYNEAAVARITKELEPYIIRVKGVRWQYKAHNKVMMIDFETDEERLYYEDTEARYIREKNKLDADIESGLVVGGGVHHLVLLTKRAVAAELCRAPHFVKKILQDTAKGFAVAIGVKFKPTVIAINKLLIEKHGWSRDMLSLVWGGGQTQLTKKQKAKQKIGQIDDAKLALLGMDREQMLKDFNLEDVEDRVIEELPDSYRLGPQSKEERQIEIDKFVAGKTIVCIYTFKAGGVGLSLHHTDELTKDWDRTVPGFAEWHAEIMRMRPENRPLPGKVRRLKSGFAVVEDIKFIPTKPRRTYTSVAYSGIDMVQSTGRVPRRNSLSDTEQFCLLYNGTVEVDIAYIYSSKLRCLHKCTRNDESWLDLIMHADRKQLVADLVKDDIEETSDSDEQIGESDED